MSAASPTVLRGAEQQVGVRVQCVVEDPHHPLLHRCLHVDEHVAARDEVEPCERRILADIVARKDDEIAYLAAHLIALVARREEARETLGRDVLLDPGWIRRRARTRERLLVHVRREILDSVRLCRVLRGPRAARWRPNRPPRRSHIRQPRSAAGRLPADSQGGPGRRRSRGLERSAVTEEARHPDE